MTSGAMTSSVISPQSPPGMAQRSTATLHADDKQVKALIAGACLSGTNTSRVRRALGALFKGAVSKDTVRRTWRKLQAYWEAWCHRSLADEMSSG
jgi:putative transposase